MAAFLRKNTDTITYKSKWCQSRFVSKPLS